MRRWLIYNVTGITSYGKMKTLKGGNKRIFQKALIWILHVYAHTLPGNVIVKVLRDRC